MKYPAPKGGTGAHGTWTESRLLVVVLGSVTASTPWFARAADVPRGPETVIERKIGGCRLGGEHMLGDWCGVRTSLADAGVVFDFHHIGDTLGNTTGGGSRETAFFGRFRGTIDVDLDPLISLPGGRIFFTAVYQYGDNLGRDVGLYTLPSSIASQEQLRIDEIFYEQSLFGDRVALRFGRLAGVNEFGAQDAFVLLNDELAYTPNINFQVGLPFSPAGQPGAMIRVGPFAGVYVKSGIYSGLRDPFNDDEHGTRWTIETDSLVSAHEVGVRVNGTATDTGPPGLYRIGGSVNYGDYMKLRSGRSVARNFVAYFMANQTLYRPPSARMPEPTLELLQSESPPVEDIEEDNRGLEAGFTAFFAPDDRNLAWLGFTGQLRYTGLLPWRPQDTLAAGFVHTMFSDAASDASRATGGSTLGTESVIQLTYQYRPTRWLLLQPDAQVVLTPRGDPDAATALVFGLRSMVTL